MYRKKIIFLILFLSLTACSAPEQNYRGVSSPLWEHLTPEQKQLVIDRSYQDEIEKS